MNLPAEGGTAPLPEQPFYSEPPPSPTPEVVFSDVVPDALQMWPIIAAVGVFLALVFTLLALALVALARSGR